MKFISITMKLDKLKFVGRVTITLNPLDVKELENGNLECKEGGIIFKSRRKILIKQSFSNTKLSCITEEKKMNDDIRDMLLLANALNNKI